MADAGAFAAEIGRDRALRPEVAATSETTTARLSAARVGMYTFPGSGVVEPETTSNDAEGGRRLALRRETRLLRGRVRGPLAASLDAPAIDLLPRLVVGQAPDGGRLRPARRASGPDPGLPAEATFDAAVRSHLPARLHQRPSVGVIILLLAAGLVVGTRGRIDRPNRPASHGARAAARLEEGRAAGVLGIRHLTTTAAIETTANGGGPRHAAGLPPPPIDGSVSGGTAADRPRGEEAGVAGAAIRTGSADKTPLPFLRTRNREAVQLMFRATKTDPGPPDEKRRRAVPHRSALNHPPRCERPSDIVPSGEGGPTAGQRAARERVEGTA